MTKTDYSIALLGLGKMGRPMAMNLLREFGELTVWNRTSGKSGELLAAGAGEAPTPREAAREIVLTVLTDLEAVENVLDGPDGLIAGWREKRVGSPVLIVHGTVSPVELVELGRRLSDLRINLIDAPVSGGTAGAEQGTLSIMVGGERTVFDRLSSVFDTIGNTVRYLGPSGSGQLAKACNQIIVAAGVTAVSESVLLARRAGLDVATLLDLLGGGLAGSELLRQKGRKWIDEDFAAGGSAVNQLKDLRFVNAAAESLGLTLPVTTEVTALFERLIADGDGELDHTGIYRAIERLARPVSQG